MNYPYGHIRHQYPTAQYIPKGIELRIIAHNTNYGEIVMMDTFTRAYIECALWSSTDESDENTGGEPLDKNYGPDDLSPDCLASMERDCAAFQATHYDYFANDPRRAGSDFWLTRNRHGAGFWDGKWSRAIGEKLTQVSHAYGEVNLYVGDDGKIYCFPG
jgi:hypothetical protein